MPSTLKQTFQRRKILDFLTSSRNHPSAVEIYAHISKEIPTISKTTVYNTVNALARDRVIKRIKVKENEMRFDAFTERHYHFICVKCGKLYDIEPTAKELLQKEMDGHKIEDVFVCFSGICKNCR